MRKSLKQRCVLYVIKISRHLFYNTPIHRNKYVNIIYRKLFRSAYTPGQELLVDYENNQYYFPSDDITILPSLLNDNYEKTEIELFKKIIRPGMTVVDVGANVGLYSVIASKAVGRDGHVHSFEPEPLNYDLLTRNIKLNKCHNVSLHELAVGEKRGILDLFKETGSIGTQSLIKKSTSTFHNSVKVKVIRLDDFFKNTSIDAIKLDAEGYELAVLQGGERLLKKVRLLFFEYNHLQKLSDIKKLKLILNGFRHFYFLNEKGSTINEINLESIPRLKYANILATREDQLL